MANAYECVLPAALATAENLPSLPGVAMEILRLSHSETAGLDDYASAIASDPALAARMLKLSNSSLFSLGQEVTTLDRATMVLGTKTVQLMSLSFSLVGQMPKGGTDGSFDYAGYWKRSLSAAVAGRELGRLLGFTLADEAFLCGLLSRLGQLVMADCMLDEYRAVIERSSGYPTRDLEQEVLGFNYSDIGAALMKAWGLPKPLYLAVACLGNPSELPEEACEATVKLTKISHLASLIVNVLCDPEKGDVLAELHTGAEELGLSSAQTHTLILALENRIKEAAELLDIELESDESHYEILDTARKQLVALSLETVGEIKEVERRSVHVDSGSRGLAAPESIDPLTGLGDRSYFEATLVREISSRMYGRACDAIAVFMIEIADFDDIQSAHGKTCAEEAIHVVGKTLRATSRDSDTPARYADHQFVILVPSSHISGLHIFAERLRASIAETLVVDRKSNLHVKTHIGVAHMSETRSLRDGGRLVDLAEQALEAARKSGPDSIEFASESDASP